MHETFKHTNKNDLSNLWSCGWYEALAPSLDSLPPPLPLSPPPPPPPPVLDLFSWSLRLLAAL